MWPAMWRSAFYDDDAQNGILADEMGIVMGTSHHEPMGLAQQDWKRRGTGEWNYTQNSAVLRDFWTKGMERCKDWETLITVGMRGDGDRPMSENANISLLQNIVKDQRKIISKVTGKKQLTHLKYGHSTKKYRSTMIKECEYRTILHCYYAMIIGGMYENCLH